MVDIEQKIKNIIHQVTELDIPVDEIESENIVERYGINSVDALEILINVENEFDITVEDEELNQDLIKSVSHLSDFVRRKICQHEHVDQ